MINTVSDVLLPDVGHRLPDHCLVAVLDQTHHLLSAQRFEFALDFLENVLDRLELEGVRDVEDPPKAEAPHGRQALFRPLDTQGIQEKADLLISVRCPEPL